MDLGIGWKPPKRNYSPLGESLGGWSGSSHTNQRSNSGKISKSLRDQVWMRYMKNKAQGKCYCCRMRPIHYTDFQVGHNKARATGGKNHISNLRPICGPCNRGMQTMSIEKYRQIHFGPKKPRRTKKSSSKEGGKKPPKPLWDIGGGLFSRI